MCPIETPEGPNIGLIGGLSSYAACQRVRLHRVALPGRQERQGHREIVYCTADEEENYVVAQANTPLDSDGTIRRRRVLVRRSPQAASLDDLRKMLEAESFFGATTEICYGAAGRSPDCIDVSPEADRVGRHGADSLPRARRRQPRPHGRQHAAPGRAVLRAEAPYIGTGMENRAPAMPPT